MTPKVKETLTIKQVIDFLNKEFPPSTVSTVLYGKKETVQFPPYFSAYKDQEVWWICCWEYWVWTDQYEAMLQCSELVFQELGIKCYPCQVAITFVKSVRDFAREQKQGVSRFIGII